MNSQLPLNQDLLEKVIVYNALVDPLFLEAIIEHAKPSYFESENIRSVFDSLTSYYAHHGKIPNLTELKIHLVDPAKRVALKEVAMSFSTIDKTYDKEVLLKNTERFLKEKAVLTTVLKTSIDVQSGEVNAEQILSSFEQACNICLVENIGMDYLESIDKHCEALQKVFKTISTGWKWLDERIGGGYQAEGRALYVFYGITNVGKSIFLGNAAVNILSQNKTVVIITLEMSEQVYAKRISAGLSQIAMDDLPMQIEPLKDALNSYKLKHQDAKLIIKEFPPQSVSANHIKNYIHRLVKSGIKPDAIIIDYLPLLACAEKGLNSYESVKKTAEQVRALSYYFECPVITASQSNRTAYGEANPGLETTSESMGVPMTADAQFSIWTEEEDFELGIIHMGINKNRFGPVKCHTVLEIDYPTLTLRDPDSVSQGFVSTKKNIPGSLTSSGNSIADTLNRITSLGDNDGDK